MIMRPQLSVRGAEICTRIVRLKGVYPALSHKLHTDIGRCHIFQIPASLSIPTMYHHIAVPWLSLKQHLCLQAVFLSECSNGDRQK